MKFPRNARLLRSTFDVAPFAAVFFLLIIFMALAVYLLAPALSLHVSMAGNLRGIDKPTVAVAIDSEGRLFYANQVVTEEKLKSNLYAAAKKSRQPLTLVVQTDKAVTYGQLVKLTLIARDAGIQDVLLAKLPRVINASNQP